MMSLCDRGDILRLYVMIIVFIFLTSCIIKHFWIGTFLKGHLCRYTLGLRTNINMNYALNLYEQHTCFVFFAVIFHFHLINTISYKRFHQICCQCCAVTYHLYITIIFHFSH